MSEKKKQQHMPAPGDVYDVPAIGSLGLLALGDIGLKAWREKREQVKKQVKQNKESNKEEK